MKYVLVTGGFDPIHSGHLSYFWKAKDLGDKLIVGLNSDKWLCNKKGKPFLPIEERIEVVSNLKMVDDVITFDDSTLSVGASDAISYLRSIISDSDEIIVANGGDRNSKNVDELLDWEDTKGVEFVFGVGGETKKNSSSDISDEWKRPKTIRSWGFFRVLQYDNPEVKLKELIVDPGKSLSMQRHEDRAEFWFVSEGTASVYTISPASSDVELHQIIKEHGSIFIKENQWHMITNETKFPLKIIEIQYGVRCEESDIIRKTLYADWT